MISSGKAPSRNSRDSSVWERWFSQFRLISSKWAPVFTSLTVAPGAGSVVYYGGYRRVYRDVFFDLIITPAGGATTASTLGVTKVAPPTLIISDGVCSVVNGTTKVNLGNGFIDRTDNHIWLPSWTATSGKIVISGRFES